MPANDPYPERAIDSAPWPELIDSGPLPWPDVPQNTAPEGPQTLNNQTPPWPEAAAWADTTWPDPAGMVPQAPETWPDPPSALVSSRDRPSHDQAAPPEWPEPVPWASPVWPDAQENITGSQVAVTNIASAGTPLWGGVDFPATQSYAHEGWQPPESLGPQPFDSRNNNSSTFDGYPEGMPPTLYPPHSAAKEVVTYNPFD